ncbi:MAG: E3 binding domain-containing protein, partial [Actinomycetota bacterium]|nr:E3 binding domain-containing protein [Actinomycetota bacterium]
MATTVQMPALGESVTEGTITRWLKAEGDTVAVDEPLLEVSTDKVDTEIPSPTAGVLQRIVAAEDETVEVGGDLAVIGDEGEAPADSGGSGGGQAQEAAEATEPAEETREEEAAAQPEPEPESEPEPEPAAASPAPSGDSSGGEGTPVTMPELGESVTEGTITRWLKQVGDEVAVDEPLLEVSTDKVDTEIPSPVAGTVLEHSAAEDDTVEVGGQLAVIGDASAAPSSGGSGGGAPAETRPAPEPEPEPEPAPKAEPKPETKASEPQAAVEETAGAAQPKQQASPPQEDSPAQEDAARQEAAPSGDGSGRDKPYVTPLVRKLATEHDVDLSTITGSGVGGRIRKQDVLAAAEAKSAPPAAPPAA